MGNFGMLRVRGEIGVCSQAFQADAAHLHFVAELPACLGLHVKQRGMGTFCGQHEAVKAQRGGMPSN
jgi:hypothetical protein